MSRIIPKELIERNAPWYIESELEGIYHQGVATGYEKALKLFKKEFQLELNRINLTIKRTKPVHEKEVLEFKKATIKSTFWRIRNKLEKQWRKKNDLKN